jgi:hypothetical protein
MITVILNELRDGHETSRTHNAGPMEALASLFEDDLWWTADIIDCSPTRLVVRTFPLSDRTDTTTFAGPEEELRTLRITVSRALISVLRCVRQPPWSNTPSASATPVRRSRLSTIES